jgi:hypothetical protein
LKEIRFTATSLILTLSERIAMQNDETIVYPNTSVVFKRTHPINSLVGVAPPNTQESSRMQREVNERAGRWIKDALAIGADQFSVEIGTVAYNGFAKAGIHVAFRCILDGEVKSHTTGLWLVPYPETGSREELADAMLHAAICVFDNTNKKDH